MGEFERMVDSYINKNTYVTPIKRSVFHLSIERDGVIKYCHSYTPNITTVDTLYFLDADDDKMSVPYGFRSFKQAEWAFWNWSKLTGQDGWYFHIEEVQY